MYCLIYVSSSVTPFDRSDVEDILSVARHRNEANEITGMLLYQGGNILQYLEGEKTAIESCFERISRDPRHHHVIRLLLQERNGRLFEDWSMGYKDLKGDSCEDEFREF